jgi:cardiolipin synthase
VTFFARLPLFTACGFAALFAGCRTPLPASRQRLQEIRSVEVNRVVAVEENGRLLLRFRLKGRDTYAVVGLPDKGADGQTAMEFQRDAKEQFSAAKKTGRPVPVLGSSMWQSISRTVTAQLAPASPRQAVLVTAGAQELLICRNAAGIPGFVPLTERPRGMNIVSRLPASKLVPRMTAALTALRPGGGPAIILTGGAPALVRLDPAAQRLTFIYAPPEEVLKLPILGASPDVTVRGLISLSVRSGVLGTLRNPVTTVTNGTANVLDAARALLHGAFVPLPFGPPPLVIDSPPMDMEQWEERLDRTTGEPRVPASVNLRINGEEFFPELIQAIQDARESIDIMLYIFDTDDYAIRIADLLKQRSKEVRIRVMIDEVASLQSSLMDPQSPQIPGHRAPSSIVDYLRSGTSIQVRPMAMPALVATHTKMIIVDGGKAWLGGMNIGREYRCDWHDMMIEVTGPLVGWMQRSFARTWAQNGWTGDLGEFLARFHTSRKASAGIPVPAGAIPVRPLQGSAIHSDIKDSQIAALRHAKQSIWIQNAYLSDSRFISELIQARYRGVDVRVILPQDNDSPLMKASARALVPQLVRHGVRVWLIPEMSHVKAAIYDGWACVGSANFDRLSLRVNREFNIGYSDPAAVGTLRRDLFLKDMARGKEVTSVPEPTVASRIKDYLLQLLAGQL